MVKAQNFLMSFHKALLVMGGVPPSAESLLWHKEEADVSIAVDSGWLSFIDAGIFPDVLVGDLDSWGGEDIRNEIPQEVEVIEEANQDRTDFQKALDYLRKYPDITEIIILGGLGNRTDHLFTNFLIVCSVDSELVIIFDSEKEWIRRVTSNTKLKIIGQEGATVSLLPITSCSSVKTAGLKWEVDNQVLSGAGSFSQSNLCISNEVWISVQSGSLLVILQK